MTTCAIILAAGKSERFGASLPKQYMKLEGESLLQRAVRPFIEHKGIDKTIVVIRQEDVVLYEQALKQSLPYVIGGSTRQESAYCGLKALVGENCRNVLIHDAARINTSMGLISKVIDTLAIYDAVDIGLPIYDTIKRKDETLQDSRVKCSTLDRTQLYRTQTPQGFNFSLIYDLHCAARQKSKECTDDISLCTDAGIPIYVVDGEEENFKVTVQSDLL